MGYTLLVSNPPHGQGNLALSAPHLGLSPADLALKAKYPIPEIWAAGEDTDRIAVVARAAEQGGLKVMLVPAAALVDIPARVVLGAVAITERSLNLLAAGAQLDLTWDVELFGVYYTPRAGAAEPLGRGVKEQGASCEAPFLDVYLPAENGLKRFTALPDTTVFTGLGEGAALSPAGRLARLAQVCQERFTSAHIDHRLMNMQVRHWPPPGPSPKLVLRKGFSFASTGLADLLARLGPGLVNISHCEFASRLAYLTLQSAEWR
jgi:hypothetical protein